MSDSKGYGGPSQRLLFNGDGSRYEQWELKFFSYMRIKNLGDVVDPESRAMLSQDKDTAFAELTQNTLMTDH